MLTTEKKNYLLQRLFEFLKIRSISSDPKFKSESLKAVQFLKQELEEIGFAKSNIKELYARGLSSKTNNPLLYGELMSNPQSPTVLIYGHYDVQPVDPLNLWTSPPFEMTIRGENIFAQNLPNRLKNFYVPLAYNFSCPSNE